MFVHLLVASLIYFLTCIVKIGSSTSNFKLTISSIDPKVHEI